MPEVRLPLSGNVSQTINPWTMMFNPVGTQIGLINVNAGDSADPEMELEMIEEVGSYGRQLGRIGDVLLILLKKVPLAELTPTEREAVAALRLQLKSVDDTKNRINKRRGNVPQAPQSERGSFHENNQITSPKAKGTAGKK